MTPVIDFIFVVGWLYLLVTAFRTIARGWNIVDEMPKGYSVEKRKVTRTPHPEMVDVKNGDELLVLNFGEEETRDPLLKSLEDRISELDEEDEDEGDGYIIVRR